MTPLTDDEVRKVARLARLHLDEAEVADMREQLTRILAHVEQLEGLDVTGVEPAPYPFAMTLPLRADEPGPTLDPADAVRNAPAREGPAFVVPRVVG